MRHDDSDLREMAGMRGMQTSALHQEVGMKQIRQYDEYEKLIVRL